MWTAFFYKDSLKYFSGMRLVKSQLSLAWVVEKRSWLAIFLYQCRYNVRDFSCLVLLSCLSCLLVECKDLCSGQAEKDVDNDNNNKQKHIHQCFTFVVTNGAEGESRSDKQIDEIVLKLIYKILISFKL
jgi:hypothetical protein